jgi:hypothetical protein
MIHKRLFKMQSCRHRVTFLPASLSTKGYGPAVMSPARGVSDRAGEIVMIDAPIERDRLAVALCDLGRV